MVIWDATAAAHLLRRAGFGAPPAEVARAVAEGREATVDRLLRFPAAAARYRGGNPYRLQRWWLLRMLRTRHPLQEKLALFWHGHFATSLGKVGEPALMADQNALFRRLGAGRFADLLLAVARDPAMLLWLDNHLNVAGSPNENFARELLELFTLGVVDEEGAPRYSQADVVDVARAFTGWGLDRHRRFAFSPDLHDAGPKTVLGLSGNLDGGDVVAHLAALPACARFLAARLWAFFAHPDPPAEVVEDLAGVYLATGGDVAAVLRALLLRDEFHGPRALAERVSPPVEFAVGVLRTLRVRTDARDLPFEIEAMGQQLFYPPNVAGWPGGASWMTSSRRLQRDRFAWSVAGARDGRSALRFDARRLLEGLPPDADGEAVVDRVLGLVGASTAPAEARDALVDYLADPGEEGAVPVDPEDGEFVDRKVRGLLGLALTIPEAHLA